jgi:ribonuclease HI
MASKLFYVVWIGHQPGVYEKWSECKAQLDGFDRPAHHAYDSLEKANDAFLNPPERLVERILEAQNQLKTPKTSTQVKHSASPLAPYVVVAGYYVEKTNCGYCALTDDAETPWLKMDVLFDSNPYLAGFIGTVHALALLAKEEKTANVYSDSKCVRHWIKQAEVNSNHFQHAGNHKTFELVERACLWLSQQAVAPSVLEWNTAKWGDNPATLLITKN